MATNFSPCKGSYILNQFPSNVMFGMNGFHVSASGAIQGHHGPLVSKSFPPVWRSGERVVVSSIPGFCPGHFCISPQKHLRKVVGGFGKKSCVITGERKPGNLCVAKRHDMTLSVKMVLNPNTTNHPTFQNPTFLGPLTTF